MASGFFFGYCPCCETVIPVPSGTKDTYCCYCGSRFRSAASIRLHGLRETEMVLGSAKADYRPPASEGQNTKKEKAEYAAPMMMTVRQLSKATGISEYALRRLLKQGKLPVFYAGSKALINYAKVLEILDTLK